MSIANVEQVIRDYLPGVIHMSLATCNDNRPWVCEVHYGYDKDLNLYFRSFTSRRHSQEIARNPRVAGNIIEPHGPTDQLRGVYFEGTAKILTSETERRDALAYFDRINLTEKAIEEAKDPAGAQFYQVTVSDYYLFDSRQSKPSQKYHLEWPKAS